MIIEKKIVSNIASDIFIRIGMLFHPKTGMTIKKAEILVSTMKKPRNRPIMNGID